MIRFKNVAMTVATAGALMLGQTALAQSDQGSSTSSSQSGQSASGTDQSDTSSSSSRSSSRSSSSDNGQMSGSQGSMSGTKSGSDADFARKAAQGSLAEIKFGQLAQQKGTDSTVKDFAQRMVTDHTKASDELKSIAQNKNMTLPDQMDSKDQAEYDRLSNMSGEQFDRAYMNYMRRDHKKDVAEFRRESEKGTDPDLKAFAAKYLPTLQEHEQMAMTGARHEHGKSMSTDNTNNPNTDNSNYPSGSKKRNRGNSGSSGSSTQTNQP